VQGAVCSRCGVSGVCGGRTCTAGNVSLMPDGVKQKTRPGESWPLTKPHAPRACRYVTLRSRTRRTELLPARQLCRHPWPNILA
jgi:hypothetical protein